MAVSTVKRWCAGGVVSKTGPHVSNVNADTKAKACKAVAEWEAKRARGRVSHAARHAVESGEVYVTLQEAAEIIGAVEGLAVEVPEPGDDLHARLDLEVARHRGFLNTHDHMGVCRQRLVIEALQRRIAEAQPPKRRVRKDGSAVPEVQPSSGVASAVTHNVQGERGN